MCACVRCRYVCLYVFMYVIMLLQHYASRSGHVTICQLLLSSGANANSQTPGGVAPLHRAAYCGNEMVVKVLLGGGAKVSLVDSDGRTPLHKVKRALECGQEESIDHLIPIPEGILLQNLNASLLSSPSPLHIILNFDKIK